MFLEIREPGMVGQKQVPMFSHVETTRGMGQVNLPVGESEQTSSGKASSLLFNCALIYVLLFLGFQEWDGQLCVYALRIVQR